ncbi:MAG: hypothetical protein SAL07_14975 [Oscillatoria sp. PMC 1051.18]|nr:hypothetical protein [Oscillatoria sp. PMC 1050.18]MEC5031199.1 hypothetical protein [Oscillatoria sp. PMC 1051.18]
MKHYCDRWLEEWCQENGWTDLVKVSKNAYWAFPPGGVMPEPIPSKILKTIKAEKGLSNPEKVWSMAAVIVTIVAAFSSYFLHSPMPIVVAFAFAAITVAQLEVEEI